MNSLHLPAGLLTSIKDHIYNTRPPKCNWPASIVLSPSAINDLLVTQSAKQKILSKVYNRYENGLIQLKHTHIHDVLRKFLPAIGRHLECKPEDISTILLDALIQKHSLDIYTKPLNINFNQLIRNTRPQIMLRLDLHHMYPYHQWRRTAQYSYVEKVLTLFNINPARIHIDFPSIPERDGNEYMEPAQLIRLWDYAWSNGQYVIPLNLDLVDFLKKSRKYKMGITICKNTEIWIHSYEDGYTSGPAFLKKDLQLLQSKMSYMLIDEDCSPESNFLLFGFHRNNKNNRIIPVEFPKNL